MYYLFISIAATAVGAIVLLLEHLGDPAALERDYARGIKSKTISNEKPTAIPRSQG
jgi:hypothetical protein